MDYGVLNSAEGEFYFYLFFINHEQLYMNWIIINIFNFTCIYIYNETLNSQIKICNVFFWNFHV